MILFDAGGEYAGYLDGTGCTVELPDHGDLIERDRLHHDLKAEAIDKFALLDDTYLRYLEGLEKAEELLLGATVVIPAERTKDD